MAFSVRLNDELKRDAVAYGERVGISLNALLVVALRDYLDRRLVAARSLESPAATAVAPAIRLPGPPAQSVKKKKRRR